ncbi:phage protein NinX family protein [Paraburkholderia ferrariae]|uniref:phage protein NinX family protein n=1 Tax=Paraburkholderia ferrariae TaxID=386056 RepID=UPI00047FF4E6|nr:phage protein NinX family protein [Paraburkholderia ferrariae]
MNVADLTGMTLDYWVARSLHDFVREIYFTDSGTKVAVRGNDRGRPWDGRFTPSTSWQAAGVVLDRAQRFELRERREGEGAFCVAEFHGGYRTVEAHGDSVRVALLRAFVMSRFGDTVGEMLQQPQALDGAIAEQVGVPGDIGDVEDLPRPDAQIGDIGTAPR